MKKILVNAYAVCPDSGSEPGMGWNWCVGLARENELFIITEGEFREQIESALKTLPQASRMHFYYNLVSKRVRRMCWNQGDWRFYLHYRNWQKKTLAIAREICRKHPIDILHQLNMIGFREPGYLWKIPDIPYVLGPTNCKFEYPLAYWKDAPLSEKVRVALKEVISRWQIRHSVRLRNAIRRASVVVAASKDAHNLFKKYLGAESVTINETGSDSGSHPRAFRSSGFLDILWVGRFNLYSKLPALAVRALQRAGNPRLRLHFVGPGNDAPFRRLAAELGIDGSCRWYGAVCHGEVQEMMRRMDVFLFTSVVEGTPHVVLEAFSNGLPVVCFDTCGQGDIVDGRAGIKIPLSDPDRSAEDFADVLNALDRDRDRLQSMSDACNDRLQELSWDAKIRRMCGMYETICSP